MFIASLRLFYPPAPIQSVDKIVEKVGSSVVNIESENSKGSGVIFRTDGYIITNDHVIRGGKSLEVHLSDKRTLKAKRVGTDSRRDVAVIKVEDNDLRAAEFADSDKVKVGDDVIAIGNAQGVENSVTKGVISNVNIDVDTDTDIRRCLQTDAPINPGNSGGALLNMRGEVIGINEMRRNNAECMCYAIPSNDAKEIAEQLIDKGYVSYPYIGVKVSNETTTEGTERFLMVRDVLDDSPAAKAGLKSGDFIVYVNDLRVETVVEFRDQLNSSGIGSMITLRVGRRTKKGIEGMDKHLKLEELPKGDMTDWS